MIANYKNCKKLLGNDFNKENDINKLLQAKVVFVDSYNFTFKHEEYGTTMESLKRGFIVPVLDTGAMGYTPKDSFLSINIKKAINDINQRLDYLYKEDRFFLERLKFSNNIKKYKNDLQHSKELEEFGKNVSVELANIMFDLRIFI